MTQREFKFRAKRLDTGVWIYGSLFIHKTDTETMYSIWSITDEEWFEVDPSTVGQFTGLLDKHGKEIWEGDILLWSSSDEQLEVRWDEFGFVLFSKLFRKFGYPNGDTCTSEQARQYIWHSEVIGNIFDTPEDGSETQLGK